jgi:prevent-host-death family protein
MEPIDIPEAERRFEEFLALTERGEEVVIARAGKPVARLTKFESKQPTIRFGGLKGKIHIADDFDAPLPPEIQAEFEADL